jgi:hypothetical protein
MLYLRESHDEGAFRRRGSAIPHRPLDTRLARQQPGAEADHVCKPTLIILLRKGANAHNEAQVRVPFGAVVRVNVQPETVW